MIKIYRVVGKILSTTLVAYGLTVAFNSAWAVKDSSTFNFTAEFVGGGCELSTSKSQVIFNGGVPILPSDIASTPPTETFDVILSNCAGVDLTPKITVAGNSIDSYGPSLFRDPSPSSTSVGYGILLSTIGNTSFNANTNMAQNKTITAKNWSAGTELNTIASTLPVVATLTCGNCDFAGRQSGDLIANVTFSFVYD